MSQEAGLNLVELTKKWGLRFLRYREVLLQLSLGVKPWWIDITFYHYLLALGCTPIGATPYATSVIFMRCGSRLVYFGRYYLDNYYRETGDKALENELKKMRKIKTLTEKEVNELRDKLAIISVDFLDFIDFALFGSEPIYLLKQGGIDLFLARVDVTFNPDLPNTSIIRIWVDTATSTNERQWFMTVSYLVKGDGTVEPGEISLSFFAWDTFRGGKIREEDVLRALDEKYLAIDGLLRNAEGVLSEGIKALVTMLLY